MPKNPFNMETIEPENNQIIEIQYNCTECESHIEIISINENENTIEFQCIKNNHKKKIKIKDYLSKIKHHNNKNANDDKCSEHNNLIYQAYCLECKKHLCNECLKLRNHINHTKNNNEIKKIEKDNLKKSEKIREELNKYKNKLNNIKETEKKKCYNNMMIELKINKDKYLQELKALKNKYAQEIKTMKNKYEINNNKIRNKYKLNNEYKNILYTTKIQNLAKNL